MLFEEERKNKIVEYVNLKERASVKELCKEFNVSASTVRRDLKELEDASRIKRTHGGAIPAESMANLEPSFGEKQSSLQNEKLELPRKLLNSLKKATQSFLIQEQQLTSWQNYCLENDL